jgi:hypothetical protein
LHHQGENFLQVLIQELCNIFAWSYEEIPSMNFTILEHHIENWPKIQLTHQLQFPFLLVEAPIVKDKVVELPNKKSLHPIPTLHVMGIQP